MTAEREEDREHQVHRKGQRGALVAREKLAGGEGDVRGINGRSPLPHTISADSSDSVLPTWIDPSRFLLSLNIICGLASC